MRFFLADLTVGASLSKTPGLLVVLFLDVLTGDLTGGGVTATTCFFLLLLTGDLSVNLTGVLRVFLAGEFEFESFSLLESFFFVLLGGVSKTTVTALGLLICSFCDLGLGMME